MDISSIPCKSAYLDQYLLDTTIDLCAKYKLTKFIETGSYHGDTAKIVSRYIRDVHTIENNPELFKISQENLKNCLNVKLHFGSSQEVLKNILSEKEENIFFFLDAHWGIYWPLLDELQVIAEKQIKPVIAIHDFFVPPDGKFGYDAHPEDGTVLNFSYIEESIEKIYDGKYEYFYNKECSDINSGIIYIYPKQ
jgi:hypothetical protein